jgi:hypothetical protein
MNPEGNFIIQKKGARGGRTAPTHTLFFGILNFNDITGHNKSGFYSYN